MDWVLEEAPDSRNVFEEIEKDDVYCFEELPIFIGGKSLCFEELPIFIGNFREGDHAADELDLGGPLGELRP